MDLPTAQPDHTTYNARWALFTERAPSARSYHCATFAQAGDLLGRLAT